MSSSRLLRHIATSSTCSDELLHKELLDSAAKGKFPLFKSQLTSLLKKTHPKDIFQPKGNKGSPLILAAQKGQNKIVSYILKNFLEVLDLEYTMTVKSDFTGHEIRGATALWCAALGGNVNIVRELIEAGANINHSNATNSTPLRAASYHNREEVIMCLLNKGADISIANQVGQAPVMIAVLRENEDALRLLVTYGKADLGQTTAAGIDSLHITIERESQKIFNLLVQLGANIIWPCRAQSPSPPIPYYTVPEVYQPPCHVFVAAKCHNEYAMDYLSKQPECTPECGVDMWLVRGIERVWDYPSSKVTEVWRRALELREKHNLGYPGKPAIDLYEGVQEVRTLTDIYTISQKQYLIQCVLISERVFGPLYCTSCDLKIRFANLLYREGSMHYWRCCELLYQLLQAVVKRTWMPTQASINEFNVLLHQVNTLLPAFNTDVMTMERFAAYFKCIYTRNPVLLEALQLLFHPLTKDESIFHSIMKSKYFLKHENVLNAFIAVSTPDMLEVSDKDGLTALHFACMLETVPDSVIHALIQAGSHLDSVTPSNRTPIESCISKLSPQYLTLRSYYPLKLACLSARIIVQYQLSTETLPAFFHTFIDLHRTPPPKIDE
ncbi:Protein fem-1-like protein C-like [Oopsacas minuta]|uniref:Protein fem-1-like protein C-like n=1 Tax=Oopsacas minuta TaxID=111878 RepID=A0AAV7JLK5_9METZ|nr:Protein fem-1-like protein C-like [Oopsacas minuta]